MGLEDDVRAVTADRAGVFGIYARNLTTGEIVAVGSDVALPTESAAKTFILLHYERAVTAGELHPAGWRS
jgi:beta-lactamase class A